MLGSARLPETELRPGDLFRIDQSAGLVNLVARDAVYCLVEVRDDGRLVYALGPGETRMVADVPPSAIRVVARGGA